MSLHDAYRALPSPLLFGHRGLNTVATENSLEAIEAAAEAGADGVEIDVRPCASGELVVMHDPTLTRTTGDRRAVAAVDRQGLETIRLQGGEAIPLLEDVLSLCAERDQFLNVELKRDVPSRTQATRALAATLGGRTSPRMVVSSFDPFMLAAFARLAPDVPAALLLSPDYPGFERLPPVVKACAIHPARTLVSPDGVRRWKTAGLRVMVWTVNDPDEAAHLVRIGVDGIISDDPARLRGPVDRAAAAGPYEGS